MRLSRASAYGLEALVFLAKQPRGTIRLINEIAGAQGLPQSFLAKIFQKFVRHGLVRSFRGRQRGYALAKSPGEILLREILEATEGPDMFDQCIFWNDRCGIAQSCRLHSRWKETKLQVRRMMERTTLEDLVS